MSWANFAHCTVAASTSIRRDRYPPCSTATSPTVCSRVYPGSSMTNARKVSSVALLRGGWPSISAHPKTSPVGKRTMQSLACCATGTINRAILCWVKLHCKTRYRTHSLLSRRCRSPTVKLTTRNAQKPPCAVRTWAHPLAGSSQSSWLRYGIGMDTGLPSSNLASAAIRRPGAAGRICFDANRPPAKCCGRTDKTALMARLSKPTAAHFYNRRVSIARR